MGLNSAPAAFTSLQHTTSTCAFAVQCHTLFDTDTHNNINSLKPVSPDIMSTTTIHKDNDLLVDNHNDAVFDIITTSLHENNAVTSNTVAITFLVTLSSTPFIHSLHVFLQLIAITSSTLTLN